MRPYVRAARETGLCSRISPTRPNPTTVGPDICPARAVGAAATISLPLGPQWLDPIKGPCHAAVPGILYRQVNRTSASKEFPGTHDLRFKKQNQKQNPSPYQDWVTLQGSFVLPTTPIWEQTNHMERGGASHRAFLSQDHQLLMRYS